MDPQTLSTWRVTGHHHDLPFVKMGSGGTGGRVYYRRSDLEAFITRHLFRNTAQPDVIPAPWRHPRESGDPAVVRLVRDAHAVRAVLPLPLGEGGVRVQTVAAAGEAPRRVPPGLSGAESTLNTTQAHGAWRIPKDSTN